MKKQEMAKKMGEPGEEGDSLRHLFNKKTGRYDMKMHSKQKGKGSLNIPKGEKNEGEKIMFGKNNSQRA